MLNNCQQLREEKCLIATMNLHATTALNVHLQDDEGKTEPIITKLKNQYVIEKQSYLNDLRAELGTLL